MSKSKPRKLLLLRKRDLLHGGRLTQSWCRTEWPDGTVTPFAWQYAADDIGVLGAKTAIGAILEHMAASRRQAPNDPDQRPGRQPKT